MADTNKYTIRFKKIFLLVIILILFIKIYWYFFSYSGIYIQTDNNINYPIKIDVTIDNLKNKHIVVNEMTMAPIKIKYKKKISNSRIKILTNGIEKEITFNSFLSQWIIIDITSNDIIVNKAFFPPTFQ